MTEKMNVAAPGPGIESEDVSNYDSLMDAEQAGGSTSGSTGSSGSSGLNEGVQEPDGLDTALEIVRSHFATYVATVDQDDLDILTLWVTHTHLVQETFTTPRLVLESPVPGSGKTTVLEHLERLAHHPVQMSSVSSPALLVRLLEAGPRTILIDEVDRSLNPNKPGIEDIIAVLNSGYKVGATRPVLVPSKESGWIPKEMSTFAPVAMAGNAPDLPEDTRSRCIEVMLMPAEEDVIAETEWEVIEDDVKLVAEVLVAAVEAVRDQVRQTRPDVPKGCRGRMKERWLPLKRVAAVASPEWAEKVDRMILRDIDNEQLARDEGFNRRPPHIVLMYDIAAVVALGETFIPTDDLIARLIRQNASKWGVDNAMSNALTPQRLGRMLSKNYKIHSGRRPDGDRARGYPVSVFVPILDRLRVPHSMKPDEPDEAAEPDVTG